MRILLIALLFSVSSASAYGETGPAEAEPLPLLSVPGLPDIALQMLMGHPGWLRMMACPEGADVRLGVDLRRPAGSVRLRCGAATLAGQSVGPLSLEVRRGRSARVELHGAGFEGWLRWEDASTSEGWALAEAPSGRVRFESVDLGLMSKLWPALALDGTMSGQLTFGPEGPALVIEFTSLRWRGELVGRVSVDAKVRAGLLVLDARWGEGVTAAVLKVRVPMTLDWRGGALRWRDAEPLEIALEAPALTPERLRPFWRAHPAADFEARITLSATGPLGGLKVEGTLDGILRGAGGVLPLTGRLAAGPRTQSGTFTVGEVLVAEVETRAHLTALRRGTAQLSAVPVDGFVSLALPLAQAAPYLPAAIYEPQGLLKGRIDLMGTLAAPQFDGALRLAEGTMTLVPLHRRLKALAVRVVADEQTFRIERLSARSGTGRIDGAGAFTLHATPKNAPSTLPLWSAWRWSGGLGVDLVRFPVVRSEIPFALLDGQIDLSVDARPDEAAWALVVSKAHADLTGLEMDSAAAVPSNAHIRYLDWANETLRSESVFAGDGRFSFALTFADPFPVRGQGIDVTLGGRIEVRRDGDKAEVRGGLSVGAGRFPLFENPFVIETGEVTMLGGDLAAGEVEGTERGHAKLGDPDQPTTPVPLEAVVLLRARGRVLNTEVEVMVRGPGRRPELVLTSDPPLPAYQIMTLLITGRVDAVDDSNGDVRRQVAKLVNRFHNPSLARQLYDRLGVDKVGLAFAGAVTQPVLTVGKQIDRRLYVETVYHHNSPPDENEKEGHVEYRLDPKWTLDTVYGDAAQGSVGVFWHTRFGGLSQP